METPLEMSWVGPTSVPPPPPLIPVASSHEGISHAPWNWREFTLLETRGTNERMMGY